MTAHTPTPWKCEPHEGTTGYVVVGKAAGYAGYVAYGAPKGTLGTELANVALIVRAVNSLAANEARIAELEAALDHIDGIASNHNGEAGEHELQARMWQIANQARAALARAGNPN